MKILWICFVWPEPTSSAAGVRTLQLVSACHTACNEVTVWSPCQSNEDRTRLDDLGIRTAQYLPNDSKFDLAIAALDPEVVVFDRFMIEEQFSWRVRQQCPRALRIVDTIDLHSLRRAREEKVRRGEDARTLTRRDLQSPDAIREIASIFRSDLSLIISAAEIELLSEQYAVPRYLLLLCRMFYPTPNATPAFEDRANFVIIGNCNHRPNMDAFKLLHREIWPRLRARLKGSGVVSPQLHVYGAYPNEELQKLHKPTMGFVVKGRADVAIDTLRGYRVNLAPLRFGAGIKGKISDGWAAGTPCVTTTIGAEGMTGGLEFGGAVQDEWNPFVEDAVRLYSDNEAWNTAQKRGIAILEALFDETKNKRDFLESVASAVQNREAHRDSNFFGAILWHQQFRSTEYFSRWIESKNSSRQTSDNPAKTAG